jgi:hypothetical protein
MHLHQKAQFGIIENKAFHLSIYPSRSLKEIHYVSIYVGRRLWRSCFTFRLGKFEVVLS